MVESLAIGVECVSPNSDCTIPDVKQRNTQNYFHSKLIQLFSRGKGEDEALFFPYFTHFPLPCSNFSNLLFLESKLSNENHAEMESDGDESSEEYDFLERRTHEFFHELKKYDMTTWDMESVYKLISSLTDLHIIEFDDFNITLSTIFAETIRHWRPEPSLTAELFLRYLQLI